MIQVATKVSLREGGYYNRVVAWNSFKLIWRYQSEDSQPHGDGTPRLVLAGIG